MTQFIIITGTPNEGFHYIGPFANRNDAQMHAACFVASDDWWLSEILPPVEAAQ